MSEGTKPEGSKPRIAYVTGSTGFLGLNIVECLVEQGWQVYALRRKSSNTRDLDRMAVTQVEGDVTDIESLRRTMPDGLDAVFHVAADTSMWSKKNERQNEININGTRNVVEVALEKKVGRFIHTSSVGAFGTIPDREISENTPSQALRSPINYYRSKYFAEKEVFAGITRGLDAVILNPAQIVGPYDYNYTPLMFRTIKSGGMLAVPKGGSVLGHVRDYARAHVTAYEKGRTGERYLLGGVHASFREVFATIGKILNCKTPSRTFPAWLMTLIAIVMDRISQYTNKEPILCTEKVILMNTDMRISSKKAEQELGFSTCSLEEMFRDAWQWMQQSGVRS
ncbi:Dihydroflavonol 4-reductase family protein [gamma proteobacterium HdN1]|nr:Dihydroflavonol 4-reductase family protein [gamma proteobacterium HdN1]